MYTFKRGLLDGIRDSAPAPTSFIYSGLTPPSIEYAADASLKALRFSTGAKSEQTYDALGRLAGSVVRAPNAQVLWDSGVYAYDGAGNIKTVGSQQFAYDKIGRLTFARLLPQATSTPAGAIYEAGYSYDPVGNMLSQSWSNVGSGGATPPDGFVFSRSFGASLNVNTNRIQSPTDYQYDPNGNLTRSKGTVLPQVVSAWDPLGRMTAFFNGDPAAATLSARVAPAARFLSDSDRLRAVTYTDDTSGAPTISLRDSSGNVVSTYREVPGAGRPVLVKDFVYGLGQLLVERTSKDTAPLLVSAAPLLSGSSFNFNVTDPGGATFDIDIETDDGYAKQLSNVTPDSAGTFWVATSDLASGVPNKVRIRRHDSESQPYSDPVVVAIDPTITGTSARQIKAMSVTRIGTDIVIRWILNVSNGKNTKVYFRRDDTGTRVALTPTSLTQSVNEYTIDSQSLASPLGSIELTQILSNGTGETNNLNARVPRVGHFLAIVEEPVWGDPEPQPTPYVYKFADAFHHRDHLGSLRIVTDGAGWKQEAYDYYPYGRQMVPYGTSEAGGTPFRFAGLERDGLLGLDYARARYKGTNDGTFASPDPVLDVLLATPHSWNKYAYVGGNPISRVDPSGLRWTLTCGAWNGNCGGGGGSGTGSGWGGGGSPFFQEVITAWGDPYPNPTGIPDPWYGSQLYVEGFPWGGPGPGIPRASGGPGNTYLQLPSSPPDLPDCSAIFSQTYDSIMNNPFFGDFGISDAMDQLNEITPVAQEVMAVDPSLRRAAIAYGFRVANVVRFAGVASAVAMLASPTIAFSIASGKADGARHRGECK